LITEKDKIYYALEYETTFLKAGS